MAVVRRTTMVVLAATAAAIVAACGPQQATTAGTGTSPTAPASPAATPSPTASAPPTGSDGRIEAAQLRSGVVTVPKWTGPDQQTAQRCPSGRLKLAGPAAEMFETQLVSVVYTNLDTDSEVETAALVKCQYGEASEQMVIAFDRDGTGIATLGKVAEGHIWSVKPAAGAGGVVVDISDTQACCSMSKDNEFHQQRTYAWVDGDFRQTAGPTSWAGKPYVTDLVLTTSPLVFGPVQNGRRKGTVTVKVTNAGAVASGRFDVSMDLSNATTSSRYLHFSEEGDGCPRECHLSLGPGATVSFTFTVSLASANLTASKVNLYVHSYGVGNPGSLDDLNHANDRASAAVRVG